MYKNHATLAKCGYLLVAAVGLTVATKAHADFASVVAKVHQLPDNTYMYEYYVATDVSGSITPYDLTISIDKNAKIYKVTAPKGWGVDLHTQWTVGLPDSLESYVDFEWPIPNRRTADIPNGSGAAIYFSFQSALAPTVVPFTVMGVNESSKANDLTNGTIQGPGTSAVPQPQASFPKNVDSVVDGR